MKHILVLGAILIACSWIGSGCGPAYPDGPQMSINSVKDRITGRWAWSISRRVEQGVEYNLTPWVKGDTLEFLSDGSLKESKYQLTGDWAFISKKKEVNLVFSRDADSLGVPKAIAFEIRRLKTKEMWLSFADDSLQIEWQLESLD